MIPEPIDPNVVLKHLKYLYEIRQKPITPLYVIISMGKLTRASEIEYILSILAKAGVIRQVTVGTAKVVAYETNSDMA